jgi:hypothetical protein
MLWPLPRRGHSCLSVAGRRQRAATPTPIISQPYAGAWGPGPLRLHRARISPPPACRGEWQAEGGEPIGPRIRLVQRVRFQRSRISPWAYGQL